HPPSTVVRASDARLHDERGMSRRYRRDDGVGNGDRRPLRDKTLLDVADGCDNRRAAANVRGPAVGRAAVVRRPAVTSTAARCGGTVADECRLLDLVVFEDAVAVRVAADV